MKISKKDKDSIITVIVLLAMAAIIAIFYVGTQYIPLFWLGVFTVGIELLYCMPMVYKKYYAVNGYDTGISAFIPGYNIVQIFTPKCAIAFIVTACITVILFVAAFMPISVYDVILSEHTAMNAPMYALNLSYLALFATSCVIGLGYCGVLHSANEMMRELYGLQQAQKTFTTYVLLFVPLLRACSLLSIIGTLNRLLSNGYAADGIAQENVLEEI